MCKIGWNRCSSFDNMQVLISNEFGLEMPIHDPNTAFLFYSLNGKQLHRDPQKHLLVRKHVTRRIEHKCRSTSFWTGYCFTQSPKCYVLQWAIHSAKRAPSHWSICTHLIHGSLAPPDSASETASQSFSDFCIAHGRASQWAAHSPQNCPFPWGIWTASNIWFLGPIRALNPNGISIGLAVFAGLTSVTDRQTDRRKDHATRSVTIGLIYVVVRYGLIIIWHKAASSQHTDGSIVFARWRQCAPPI